MATKQFSPIKQLLTDSWDATKIVALPLIRLGLITVSLEVGLILILGLIATAFGFSTHMFDGLMKGSFVPADMMRIGVFGGLTFFIWMILAIFIGTVAQISGYTIIQAADPNTSAWAEMKKNKGLVLTLWGAGALVALLVLGNMFLLVIPGIVVGVLFTFTVLGIVLKGYGAQDSMKRSVALVSSNFMELALRWLVIIGISALISLVFSRTSHRPQAEGIIGLLNMVVNIGFTLFSLVYTVKLYEQAESATPKEKTSSLTWIIVLAAIGWIIAIMMGRGVFRYISSDEGQRFLNRQIRQQDPMMDPNRYMNSNY